MVARNDDCRGQIEALRHHCGILDGQNRHLNHELERFVETDEQIRATLNRREHVSMLQSRQSVEASQSAHYVHRASPRRHSPLRM